MSLNEVPLSTPFRWPSLHTLEGFPGFGFYRSSSRGQLTAARVTPALGLCAERALLELPQVGLSESLISRTRRAFVGTRPAKPSAPRGDSFPSL